MSNRRERLADLRTMPTIAQLDHRHLLNKDGKLPFLEGMTRTERRKLNAGAKKIALQYNKLLKHLYNSGVGFPVDQTTRAMTAEYNHRFASSGTQNQPVSFNYFEPFSDIKIMKGSVAPYASLRPETNHLFSVPDFLEFLTSDDSEGFETESLLSLPEAQTFHFSNSGNVEELTFFDVSAREYVISGFSMVRRGNSIHWFLVAGEKLTPEEWELKVENTPDIDIERISPWKRAFLKDSVERSGNSPGAPMKLEGTESSMRTLVAGEFDASEEKHLGKCIFIETENTFGVFSDDPEILVAIKEADKKKIINGAMERIAQADILWNLAEGFLQLPQYFETRVTVSRDLVKGYGKRHGLKGKGGKGVSADYVAVEAVAIEESEAPSVIRRVSMPHYATETEGHWRRLKIGQTGKDRDGAPVSGKTWVNRKSPWRNREDRNNVVFVKDCLAVAKTRIEELYAASEVETNDDPSSSEERGQLYVLRCTLMDENVYKVGWTSGTAFERAEQLSAATGVPLAFVVVESWVYSDAEALEADVHALLAPYRVNNRREFFRLSFENIRKIIVQTIERVSGT
jgi:hypothetical protein